MGSVPVLPVRVRALVYFVGGVGALVVSDSGLKLYLQPVGYDWYLLAALTILSGSFTVRLPSVPARLSISDLFVFTSVLLYGTAAGTLTVALDSLIISIWRLRRGEGLYRPVFNTAAAALSIFVAGSLFFLIAGLSAPVTSVSDSRSLVALAAFTGTYFLVNTWLVTAVISLERQRSSVRVWRENFLWLGLDYLGAASIAALLVTYVAGRHLLAIGIIVPLWVISYLTVKTSIGRVEDANRHVTLVNKLYLSTIEALAMAVDAKDQITHGHIRRVQVYAVRLAREIGMTDDGDTRAVEAAALLHDMGKLAVPEYILNKPGKLTPAEFEKMKLHASVGADILSSIEFPYPVVPIVRHHHENWDGTGYPDGLKGTEIPVGARILAVVDCFDALTSDRPYRPRLSDEDALKILNDRRGSMYDPLVVDKFLSIHSQVSPILAHKASDNAALAAISKASHNHLAAMPLQPSLEQISSSAEEMLALYDLARSLRSDIGFQDLADLISKHLKRLLPSCTCAIYVYDRSTDELSASYASGAGATVITGSRIPIGQRVAGWIAANRQSIVNSDPILDLGDVARTTKPRLRSCLGAPIVDEDQLVGTMTLYSAIPEGFTEEHRRILEAVATQAAPTIRRALEFDHARQTAMTDSITGLPNSEHLRRLFDSPARNQDAGHRLAILLIDIDGLKGVNQRHGRPTGDQVLRSVAAATRVGLRSGDILFRLRSDEFVAILAEADEATLKIVADRIRASISSAHSAIPPRHETITASVSWAAAPVDGFSLDELLATARKRLTKDALRPGAPGSDRSLVH